MFDAAHLLQPLKGSDWLIDRSPLMEYICSGGRTVQCGVGKESAALVQNRVWGRSECIWGQMVVCSIKWREKKTEFIVWGARNWSSHTESPDQLRNGQPNWIWKGRWCHLVAAEVNKSSLQRLHWVFKVDNNESLHEENDHHTLCGWFCTRD